MEEKDLQDFRKLLMERLEELLDQADNTVSGINNPERKRLQIPPTELHWRRTVISCFAFETVKTS